MKTLMVGMSLVTLVLLADAQDAKQPPKPGQEHRLLKQFEGRWDTVTTNAHEGKTVECKGAEADKIANHGKHWFVVMPGVEVPKVIRAEAA